jgi:hypothetical protein
LQLRKSVTTSRQSLHHSSFRRKHFGLFEEAKNWLDGEPIATQGQADMVQKLLRDIQAAEKEADERRTTENEPFDAGKAEVQARYAPLIANTKTTKGLTVLAVDACKKALAPWLIKIDNENRAKAEALRKEAEEKQRIAMEAMRQRDGVDLEASARPKKWSRRRRLPRPKRAAPTTPRRRLKAKGVRLAFATTTPRKSSTPRRLRGTSGRRIAADMETFLAGMASKLGRRWQPCHPRRHSSPRKAGTMTTPKVYEAICAVMEEIGHSGISKGRKNQQQGYNFRGIDDVYNELNSLLSKHKVIMTPRILTRDVAERTTQKGGVLFYVTVEAEFDFISAEDGSKHTVRTFGEAMDSADKATNKAMSAAYKYAAMMVFCIPTEGDNDADAVTHEVAPKGHGQGGQLCRAKARARSHRG